MYRDRYNKGVYFSWFFVEILLKLKVLYLWLDRFKRFIDY